MTVHLDLSPDEDSGWLARVAAGDSEDIWEQLDEDDRKRRADSAQVDALAQELADRDLFAEEVADRIAQVYFETISDEELRELRKQALQSDSDADYVDTLATVIIDNGERLERSTPVATDVQRAPSLTYLEYYDQLVSYTSPTALKFATAFFTKERPGVHSIIPATLPVVEFSGDPEHLTADYSTEFEDPPSQTSDSH